VRNPSFVRPWQHVLDPLNGYLLIGSKLISGESVFGAYNFGPGEKSKLTVNEIVDVARKFWPHGCDISFELQPSGMPETPYLWLSSDLARKDLGWRNTYEATEAVQLTLLWELEAMNEDATQILVKQINNFYKVRL
jgi:CDP-glucose 4,6-dehydratase